ncbi:MAG: Mu transposase C-terminal domain-containing protein [Thermodesulfobacteriota bacterium]|nr:Mu transposase C-terminal domain-containing protein [Thermodesulfobacteriota bacterium]
MKASNITILDRLNEAFFAWIDEEKIRIAFLWRELRTPDKTGVIRLFNRPYKLSPTLAKRRVEIRYDPEHLHQIDIYLDGSFRQRAKALQVSPHRAPKEILPIPQDLLADEKIDYLAWLTQRHRAKTRLTSPGEKEDNKQNRQGFLSILRDRIDPEVFDQDEAIDFFETYGPFNLQRLENILTDLLAAHPANLHLSFYLNHIQNQLIGGPS